MKVSAIVSFASKNDHQRKIEEQDTVYFKASSGANYVVYFHKLNKNKVWYFGLRKNGNLEANIPIKNYWALKRAMKLLPLTSMRLSFNHTANRHECRYQEITSDALILRIRKLQNGQVKQ
jgi:hypothetical protein